MAGSYFLTTAIDYVNSAPHLGHAYEKVLADFFARHQASLERDVLFLTGVDEHGQKVQQSAQKKGVEPQAFADEMTQFFRDQHSSLAVVSTKFVRTTDPAHKQVVRDWLQKLHDKGEIFFQEHEGFYSVRQEQFVTEKDKIDDQWPEIFGEVVPMKEPNYYFRLEPYRERLLRHLEAHPDWIVPAFRRNELLGALREPLADLCISRPKARLAWGIPLPFAEDYVTYVWFDALDELLFLRRRQGRAPLAAGPANHRQGHPDSRARRLLADHAHGAGPRVAQTPSRGARLVAESGRQDQQVGFELARRSRRVRGEVRPRRACATSSCAKW